MSTPSQAVARVEANPSSGTVEGVARPFCILCGDVGTKLYDGMVDWLFEVPGKWGMRWCAKCEVAWLDPQPADRDIPGLYAHYQTHASQPGPRRLGRLQQAVAKCVLSRIGYPVDCPKGVLPRMLGYLPGVKRYAKFTVLGLRPTSSEKLLDVGCGNGEFISRMRAFGWAVSGVDPDPAAVAHGQSQGLEIFRGLISDVPAATVYDVITLNHVIEHVADPVGFLRECRKRVIPNGGRLIITTPNVNSMGHKYFKKYWRGLEVPRHFNVFSIAGLEDCLKKAGFAAVSTTTETRLGPMIYQQSSCARAGGLQIGAKTAYGASTKIAAHVFRLIESWMVGLGWNAGEEIFSVSRVSAE
jgi:2-polyprenyl-3-methyl-5-hydroxy-6-metoxy-1,4-benzoquinol methylase